MCGINGFNFKDPTLIRQMTKSTDHRGPDASDVWIGEGVSFGHNRLAIIDLSPRGHQPMWDTEGELVIIFNGEIYNYQELRLELQSEYRFNSESDTEVILNAYKKYGSECVKKFNGIFAFAIWDTRSHELFLARDHVGVKPLYYFHEGKKFIFSSEIKSILEHDIPREIDREAFNLFFQVLYVPEPRTMFQGVKKFPAGHYALLNSDGTFEMTRYWNVISKKMDQSYGDTAKEIRELFRDSVKHQLISDRPVGVFLSGGLDSTAVLGAAAEFHKGVIQTFSVGFKHAIQSEKFNADANLARKTAAHYNTDHHELMVGPNDVWKEIEHIAWHMDEPNFNATAGAIFLLSRYAKESVAVVLGGDGADELFGGYPRYYYSRLISTYQKLGGIGKFVSLMIGKIGYQNAAEKLKLPSTEFRVLAFLAQKTNYLSTIIASGINRSNAGQENFHERYFKNTHSPQLNDFENYFMHIDREGWLVDESLMRTDKMTMSHGLEARVPILDYRLVELSENIPTNWKFSLWQNPKTFQGKKIWKDAVREYLPQHIMNQEKRGWFTPMAKWLRNELKDPVTAVLEEAKQNTEYFNPVGIEHIWKEHREGRGYHLNTIWAIVMWQLWYNRFIKK